MGGLSEIDRRQMTHWGAGRGQMSPELLAREAAAQQEQALYAQPTDPTVAGFPVSEHLPPHLRPAWRGMGILGEMLAPSAMKDNPGTVGLLTDVAGSVPMSKGILAMAAVPGSIKGIRAFHGSPHSFDRFDLSKIGTGEGAQAYGHGLYFAENEKVAKGYRDQLAGVPVLQMANGETMPPLVAQFVSGYSDVNNARQYLREAIAQYDAGTTPEFIVKAWKNNPHGYKQYMDQMRAAEEFLTKNGDRFVSSGKGHMYEVNINANPDDFLDWDKPLKDQPVADQVRSLVPDDLRKSFDYNFDRGIEGSNAYRNWVSPQSFPIRDSASAPWRASNAKTYEEALAMVGGDKSLVNRLINLSPPATSNVLREAGIPGIKYLDQGSRTLNVQMLSPKETTSGQWLVKHIPNGDVLYRGNDEAAARAAYDAAPKPSRNYVVFDDKLIGILRKYGIGPFALGGAMAAGGDAEARQ